MEGLRKSLSRLSLAEPHVNLSAQNLMKAAMLKNGWLRYRRKYFFIFSNMRLLNHFVNRFIRWPNRFTILTTDALHVFKTEFQNKTERTLSLSEIESVVMCADTEIYKWCVKLQPKNAEDPPLLLAATTETELEDWYKKIKEALDKFKDACGQPAEPGIYSEINEDEENIYHDVELVGNSADSLITYQGTREELVELMEMCAVRGNYVTRHSRTEDRAVLSVYDGSSLREYKIFQEGDKLSLNWKVTFDHLRELTEYYEMCTLPKSTNLKLTGPFNTFRPSNSGTH